MRCKELSQLLKVYFLVQINCTNIQNMSCFFTRDNVKNNELNIYLEIILSQKDSVVIFKSVSK